MPEVRKTPYDYTRPTDEELEPTGDYKKLLVTAGSSPAPSEFSTHVSESQNHSGDGDNTDDFDTKKSGLHHITQMLHGTLSYGEWMDEFVALCLVLLTYLCLFGSASRWFWWILVGMIHGKPPSAVQLAKLSGDVILGVALLAIVLLWTTICYKSTSVHSFWQGKYTKMLTNTLMPGGFAPRPTALSLGTLMFVTSTLIKEDLKKGSELDEHTINGYEGCRAVEMARMNADQFWFNRLSRHGPANMGYTCFNVNQSDPLGYVFTSAPFTWQDYQNISELAHPKIQVIDHSRNTWMSDLRNGFIAFWSQHFVSQDQEVRVSEHGVAILWECKYQCIKWQSVGIKSLLSSVSILLVGCATITKFTDLMSRNFGGKRLKGQFVTEDTSSDEMFAILKRTLKRSCLPKSRTLCFVILISALVVPLFVIAPKICLDGYYSVDYWVSGVFISSLVIALILRRWNPYLNAPMVYTKKLWEEGEDKFVRINPEKNTEYVKLDLYQWFHLSAKQRNGHLFKYARRVSADDVDVEIRRQKKAQDECLSVKSKSKDGLLPEIDGIYAWQKPKKSSHWMHTMSGEDTMGSYKHATLTDTTFEYIDRQHMWKLTTCAAGTVKVYWSRSTEHGNRPPEGQWTAQRESDIVVGCQGWCHTVTPSGDEVSLSVTPSAGAKDKNTKGDVDAAAGEKIPGGVVPKHFRLKKGKVYYDPALDDEGQPLLVMSLNTFEDEEWIEGVEGDDDPDLWEGDDRFSRKTLEGDVLPPAAIGSKFLVRKARTTIATGTVGVVVAKKSKDEAVIMWCIGKKRFFPPLKDKHPDDVTDHRIKAAVKLSNVIEVGESWRQAKRDIKKLQDTKGTGLCVDDLTMNAMKEPSMEQQMPVCYREPGIVAELAEFEKISNVA